MTLNQFFNTATQLGFSCYELDASISLTDIANLSLPEGQISTLQVPCPAHPQTFDAQFSTLNRYEREAARKAALNTFQLAADLKAKAVIINLGRIDISFKLEKALYQAWQTQGHQSDTFQTLKRELITMRNRNVPRHLEAALHDIEYLANQAQKYGLKIGIVTPNAYTALPMPEELNVILTEFGDPVYYWHNPAQTKIFESLDLMPQTVWDDMLNTHTLGVYLHDVSGLQSLLPPSNQEQSAAGVNFKQLATQISNQTLLTCLFSAKHPQEIVQNSLKMYQQIFKR